MDRAVARDGGIAADRAGERLPAFATGVADARIRRTGLAGDGGLPTGRMARLPEAAQLAAVIAATALHPMNRSRRWSKTSINEVFE
jgi:hypothetical protein